MTAVNSILDSYKKALGHKKNKNSVPNELMSQEERIFEQKSQAQKMKKKNTGLLEKENYKINTLDGRELLI